METTFKIIVVGARAVGKTSFIQRFANGSFVDGYKTTIGVDFTLKVVSRDGRRIKLNFWDISGQEYVVSMTRVYYKDAHAAIVMFDLTDPASLEMSAKWKKDIDAKCTLPDGSPVPVMLIANKADLVKQRLVNNETIEEFVAQQKITSWLEVSVKQNTNVSESIEKLLDELLAGEERRRSMGPKDDADSEGRLKIPAEPAHPGGSHGKKLVARCPCL